MKHYSLTPSCRASNQVYRDGACIYAGKRCNSADDEAWIEGETGIRLYKRGSGTRGGARTHGLLLRRQTLYPLSYPRITAMVAVSAAGVKATMTPTVTD